MTVAIAGRLSRSVAQHSLMISRRSNKLYCVPEEADFGETPRARFDAHGTREGGTVTVKVDGLHFGREYRCVIDAQNASTTTRGTEHIFAVPKKISHPLLAEQAKLADI